MGAAVIEAYLNIVAATIARLESGGRHLGDEQGCRTPPYREDDADDGDR